MTKGRGQKRIKYQGDDTGKELEEATENDIKEEEEILDQGPPKHRRTSETPAREAAPTEKETFLQVFNKFMKTRAPRAPKVEKMVQGPTPVKLKLRELNKESWVKVEGRERKEKNLVLELRSRKGSRSSLRKGPRSRTIRTKALEEPTKIWGLQ